MSADISDACQMMRFAILLMPLAFMPPCFQSPADADYFFRHLFR
jgi:hypothetical protein